MLQDFPADQPQSYINWVAFGGSKDSGLFRAKLLADYSTAPDRKDKLNVEVLQPVVLLPMAWPRMALPFCGIPGDTVAWQTRALQSLGTVLVLPRCYPDGYLIPALCSSSTRHSCWARCRSHR